MEFCSDMFLLPLGVPPIDSIDLDRDTYIRPDPKPNPPKRNFVSGIIPKSSDLSYYDFLINKLEFNNNDFVSKILSSNNKTATSDPLLPKDAAEPTPRPPPSPPMRSKLEPIFETQESDEVV